MSSGDDYMSDSIIKECKDVKGEKPRKFERELNIYKKTKYENFKNTKSGQKILSEEQHKEMMEKKIEKDNIGFKMLQKMGYKEGTSLGKTDSGIVEPIKTEIKRGRGGVGKDSEEKRKKQLLLNHQLKIRNTRGEIFKNRLTISLKERELRKDLKTLRKSCQDLDLRHEKTQPYHKYFWPLPKNNHDNRIDPECKKMTTLEKLVNSETQTEDFTDDSHLNEDQLLSLTHDISDYLRTTYLYCPWCACLFEDSEDLEANCPGIIKDLHDF